jgi:hypothetical protein
VIAPFLSGLVALEYFLLIFGDDNAPISATLTIISLVVFAITTAVSFLMPLII